jgi:Mg2+/Co2+ transporter CorB
MSVTTTILAILFFLMISAFFSAAETSLTGSSRAKLHGMEKNGSVGAKQVSKIIAKPDKMLSTILLGNTVVNSASSALITSLLIVNFGEAGIAYATVIISFMLLIFTEILPKTLAARTPEKIAVYVSFPLQIIIVILKPITKLIRWLVRGMLMLLGLQDKLNSRFNVDDLRGAIGLSQEHGLLAETERHMLESVLELDKLTVSELMQHRSKIMSLNINTPPAELFRQIVDASYSRFPIWEGDRENIIGTIHAKDFYAAYAGHLADNSEFNLRDLMQEPYFIPCTALVTNQLIQFRTHRKHMGLVVDEYGDMQGIITLEDILEEIVGEIEDEHDMAHPSAHLEPDGSLILTASMPIRNLNKLMGWQLPDDDHVSLGGLIAAQARGIPDEGTKVTASGITFEVLSKRKNAILKLRALPRPTNKAPKRD